MATRVVDTSSTFENWRQKYNDLATDVGSIGNLVTGDKSSVVNAINYLQDQYFFFQDFDYDGSDGATSNTVYSGADNGGNTLSYASGKVLVFKNGALLRSGTDYTAANGTSVTLASSANNGDVIRITSFTGSYQGVGGAAGTSGTDQWLLSGGVLYNKNTDGLIFNADSTINNSLDVSNSIQFENAAYFKDDVYVNAQKDIRFRDADSSHYVAIQAPTTVSANVTLTLPSDDGTASQFLQTDGDGALTWATALTSAPTATDITVSANNSTNETVYPVFVDGATGAQGIESDTGLTYNPSSGTLTSTVFVGALTGNVTGNASGTAATVTGGTQASITSAANLVTVGTIGTGVWQGTAINQTYLTGQSGTNTGDQTNISGSSATCSGLAGSATVLATGRTIGMTGDVAWTSASFTGAGNVTGTSTIQTDAVDIAMLSASGSAGSSTFLRGDNTWATPTDTNTTYSVGDGGLTQNNFTNADHSKLDGIAASATNTAAPHYTSAISVGDGGLTQNNFTNTLKSKLDGIAASATNTAAANDATITITSGTGLTGGADFTTNQSGNETITLNVVGGTGVTANANDIAIGQSVATNCTFACSTVTATGDITSNTSSDIVLKENLINIPNPLEKIAKIGGYMFDWKDHGYEDVHGKGHDTGIIAQEIEAILPEIVNTRESGIKGVNYMKLIPLLIESIKELSKEVESLKDSKT